METLRHDLICRRLGSACLMQADVIRSALRDSMPARETVDLLLQAARVAHTSRAASQLGPAEWMALRFFARANVFSRRPSALADYEAASRAAVSRVIARLEIGGYLRRQPSPDDRRSYSLAVTPKGEEALRDDPIGNLVLAVGLLSAEAREALDEGLRMLLTRLSKIGARRQFGSCRECLHLTTPFTTCEDAAGRHACNRLGVSVGEEEMSLLCAYFRPLTVPDAPDHEITGEPDHPRHFKIDRN